jgi:5-methylcytosine-specific restriction endonuclease McrA
MTLTRPDSSAQVEFLTKIQRLLTEGSFTATYKFALLHALADLSVEKGADSDEPLRLGTEEIADKFIQYYWKQVRPYSAIDGGDAGSMQVLRQNNNGQAEIVSLLEGAFGDNEGSLSQFKNTQSYGRIKKQVRDTIEEMPLSRLQRVGSEELQFLYRCPEGGEHEITLLPGVSYCFRQFHELIIDLVQAAWIRWIRRVRSNQKILGQASDLADWLFGAERASLLVYRPILTEHQNGLCFYCEKSLKNDGAVDHFIPWSRYAVDLGHNFVVAHSKCNSSKSDLLAAIPHLERWWNRNEVHGGALAAEMNTRKIIHDLERSNMVALWAYVQAAKNKSLLWSAGKTLVPVDLDRLQGVFGRVEWS